MGSIKPKNYKPGLKVTTNAYDATNNENLLTSSEYFDFNEVGIYDTQENKWIEISEEDLKDPEKLKQYDDSRYAIALGSDMNNIDGFMNMDSYLSEIGITETVQEQDSENSKVVESLGSEAAHDEHVRQLREQRAEKSNQETKDPSELIQKLGVTPWQTQDENGASKLKQDLQNSNNGNSSSSASNEASSDSNTGVDTHTIGENVISRAVGTITEAINNLGSSNNTNAQPASNGNASNGSGGGAAELNQALQGSNPFFTEPKNYGPSYMGGEPYQK